MNIYFYNNQLAFRVWTQALWNWTPSISTWYHVAFTFSNSTTNTNGEYHSLYIDGVLKPLTWSWGSDSSTNLSTNSNNLDIGHRTGTSLWFPGVIDDVRIYNYARTADEIRIDYNAGLSTYFK